MRYAKSGLSLTVKKESGEEGRYQVDNSNECGSESCVKVGLFKDFARVEHDCVDSRKLLETAENAANDGGIHVPGVAAGRLVRRRVVRRGLALVNADALNSQLHLIFVVQLAHQLIQLSILLGLLKHLWGIVSEHCE